MQVRALEPIGSAFGGLLRVTWLPPLDTGGASQLSFLVRVSYGSHEEVATVLGNATNSCTARVEFKKGYFPLDTLLHVSVKAASQYGSGTAAELVVRTARVKSPPLPPLNGSVEAILGNGVVSFRWDIPLDGGGDPISG